MPWGAVVDLSMTADGLAVDVSAPTADGLDQLKPVVAEHIGRFAFREGSLAFDWRDGSAPAPGS